MPHDFRSGSSISLPCRHCGKLSLRVSFQEGASSPACPRCGNVTDVKISVEEGQMRVRTAKGPTRNGS